MHGSYISLFAKTCHDKLSKFARRKDFLCLRIDELRDEPVLVDMHAAEFRTLACHSRTAQLAHAVVLRTDELIAPYLMHLVAHRLCHALASEKPDMQLQVF